MPVRKIVIVGHGLAAWMCASACARSLRGTAVRIVVVPPGALNAAADDSLGVPLVAECGSPTIRRFHSAYGYDEKSLVRSTRSGYSLGYAISDWSASGDVFNPFGEIGSVLGPVSFLQLGHRVRDLGKAFKLANFSLAALLAQTGRFAASEGSGHAAFSSLDHGLQIDVAAYTQALKADAIASSVVECLSSFKHANIDESGYVQAIITESGEVIDGDLFIDCSGSRRSLASHIHATRFADWSQWMLCNQIANALVADSVIPRPFVHLVAQPAGWLRFASLQGCHGEMLCVNGDHSNIGDINVHSFTSGYFEAPWQKNCVTIGGASALIDPALSLSLSWLASGIMRLIDLIPDAPQCIHEAAEFNRQSAAEIECARDYVIAHYKLNGRTGDRFWDACRIMEIPDSLQHRIEVYRNCGRVVMRDGEQVDQMNWAILFDAGNIVPLQYDVVARGIPESLLEEHLNSLRETFIQAARTAPLYQSSINQKF